MVEESEPRQSYRDAVQWFKDNGLKTIHKRQPKNMEEIRWFCRGKWAIHAEKHSKGFTSFLHQLYI